MPPPNLTREQAIMRSELLQVRSYRIQLDLTERADPSGAGIFKSTTVIRFESRRAGAETWVDLIAASVTRVVLNGRDVDVSGYREEEGIRLMGLARNNELVVEASCRYMNTGAGLHRFVDPVDGGVYLFSQAETADAKRIFACFDQPDLRAVYRVGVLAPVAWNVISNARVQQRDLLDARTAQWVFEPTRPLPTYLVAVVAGPYQEWRGTYTQAGRTVPLGIFCRSSLGEHMDPQRLLEETRQGLAFFEATFGTQYPFDKYDQCFVPDFNGEAMENAACVVFHEDLIFRGRVTRHSYERRCGTLLHELAHMWFGDLVTMRWWDDLWLNEGFATWASHLCQAEATQYVDAWATFAAVEKPWAYEQDQLPSSHPVACDIPDLRAVEVNFDGITYAKGASVIKQLVASIGLDCFLAGLRIYFRRHAWGTATLDHLVSALEEGSGRDLKSWSHQWLQTAGISTLRPRFRVDGEGRFTEFDVVQEPSAETEDSLRVHRLAVGVYDESGDGGLVCRHRAEVDIDGQRTAVRDLIGVPRGTVVLVNDADLTYCSARFDRATLGVLVTRVEDVRDPLARTLCWSTAWEMTRSAELRARDFVGMVLTGVGSETAIGVVQLVLHRAGTALSFFVEPAWEATGWARVAARLVELAITAEPGSDRQLAFVRSLAGCVLTPDQTAMLSGWLDESPALPGLSLDADLRWRLLQGLVAHGAAGKEEIARELDADRTAIGSRHAEQALALVPTAESKATAWRRVVVTGASNATDLALAQGFWHPAQAHLTAPYVARYFDEIEQVWDRRTSEAAQFVARTLFPRWAVGEATLRLADDWLKGQHASGLQRLVLEGRADVGRAVAARKFDGS